MHCPSSTHSLFWTCPFSRLARRHIYPAGIYLLKVSNRNTRTSCEICSRLTIKIPERRYRRFFVNFEHMSHLALLFVVNFEHVISSWAEPCQISFMELFIENSYRLKAPEYFCKKSSIIASWHTPMHLLTLRHYFLSLRVVLVPLVFHDRR